MQIKEREKDIENAIKSYLEYREGNEKKGVVK